MTLSRILRLFVRATQAATRKYLYDSALLSSTLNQLKLSFTCYGEATDVIRA